MKKKINSIRGMHDYLPEELSVWNYIENVIKEVLNSYCYKEIRLPLLEKTDIFQRVIGNITDIVQKEMYSFKDRKNNNITLRPEGTVGCVRAVIQHNLLCNKNPRFWYFGPMFRYERPQKGRYRQFYQFGAEAFGLKTEDIDLEMIMLTHRIWKRLGLHSHITLEINSIGSQQDRYEYKNILILFLQKYKNLLDIESKNRLYTNPLRILDSKNENIKKILKKAPLLSDYINVLSQNTFKNLCNMLDIYGINYMHNKYLVRGLDYYNDTVFEWKSNFLGAQNTICAGGRYNSLIEELGGKKTSGIGFAIGMERLVLLSQLLNMIYIKPQYIDVYIIVLGNNKKESIYISEDIKNLNSKLKIFIDISQSNLSKKLHNAIISYSPIAIIIGDDEVKNKYFILKYLKEKTQNFCTHKDLLFKIQSFFQGKV